MKIVIKISELMMFLSVGIDCQMTELFSMGLADLLKGNLHSQNDLLVRSVLISVRSMIIQSEALRKKLIDCGLIRHIFDSLPTLLNEEIFHKEISHMLLSITSYFENSSESDILKTSDFLTVLLDNNRNKTILLNSIKSDCSYKRIYVPS